MNEERGKIDIWILLPVLFLLIFSIGAVYSASSSFALDEFSDPMYLFKQHALRVIVSIFFIFLFAKIDYRYLQDAAKPLIIVSILLLLYIFIGGQSSVKGAARWIFIGPFSFQPSDLAKFTLLIYISALLVKKKDYAWMLYRGYLPILFYLLLVTGLVALQPNFSTSLIIFGTGILILFNSNVKKKHIMYTIVALIPLGIIFVLSKAYIIDRITSHAEYTGGGDSNYQLYQAIIGFGNGGLFGIGPGNSLQREFFLPEAHGDFIYSIIGEEYGFIGTMAVLMLFMVIMFRGFKVSKEIKDDFGRYVSFGITAVITAYAVINMFVSTGIAPTTGVPMPFISYGGTAMIINSIAIGILLNISSFRNEPKTTFAEEPEGEVLNI
ncbi:MAG: cell division protein FtsW [Ignavibacteriae bacterium]|nr:cell division protein FtsW [Ignavibacteriota bacterium]MCB0725120.1 cell division protein FtsW [Ignavibacteriota bacterium]MCB9242556.1 cell division protein FtsW [Ignavibacteriales bacterium]